MCCLVCALGVCLKVRVLPGWWVGSWLPDTSRVYTFQGQCRTPIGRDRLKPFSSAHKPNPYFPACCGAALGQDSTGFPHPCTGGSLRGYPYVRSSGLPHCVPILTRWTQALSHDKEMCEANAKDPLCPQKGSIKGLMDMIDGVRLPYITSYMRP